MTYQRKGAIGGRQITGTSWQEVRAQFTMERLHVLIPKDMRQSLNDIAEMKNLSLGSVVREALACFLNAEYSEDQAP
jgi:hypothetical protein